ncbi:MAG TPA: anti-sigma regulatory factor [Herpetosiphonaceae bacterium]|jgi:serine/threonine-protein kinase RsbT|nr:anti-sigma regulatory factor [Herpetosiphonaceae bacterium]
MLMAMPKVINIQSDLDIVAARMAARDMAKAMGFGAIDQARIATAISELARNIYLYAGEGTVTVSEVQQGIRKGLQVICEDQGPGIDDINLVMQDGYTTSKGMGMGLPGARRLMDDFEVISIVGEGTKITCRKWKR